MGMWDKDKEIGRRLDAVFPPGTYVVVHSVERDGEIQTDLGPAKKTRIVAALLKNPQDRQEVTTLSSAIASKAEMASADDFPVVAQVLKVPTDKGNDALVLQYVRDYDADESEGNSVAPTPAASSDQEIPF